MPAHLFPTISEPAIDVDELNAGGANCFRQLRRFYWDAFFKEAQTLLVQKEHADAIVNRAFIKCWLHSYEFISLDHFVGFLNFSLRTFCNADNKGATQRAMHQEDILEKILSADSIKVNASLALPAQFSEPDDLAKNVFLAHYKRQMGIADIARIFNLSIPEMEKHLNTAYQLLKFILSA